MSAIEKREAEQWPAFLDDVCGDDAQLRGQVEGLLRAHVELGSIHISEPTATITPPITEQPGAIIGPYKLLEQIGEGGFGVVYLAEQTEPVRRQVALKVIKAGMDIKEVIARFEAERQALALMDHPNIAKVLDAGNTEESSKSEARNPKQIQNTKSESGNRGRVQFVRSTRRAVPANWTCPFFRG